MRDHLGNARAIADYLEFRPSMLETSLQGSDEPYDRKARGGTRPPVPEKAFEWMDAGIEFHVVRGDLDENVGRYQSLKYQSALHAIIEAYRQGIERYRGVQWSVVVNELWNDPACVGRWRDRERDYARAFDALCARIAGDFGQLYPNVRIIVSISEKARAARRKTREAQTRYTLEEYARIVRSIEEIEREHKCTRKAAIGLLMDRTEYSAPKIRKAIERINKEDVA